MASLPPHPSPCHPSYLLCSQPGLGSGPGSAHAHYYTSDIPQGRIFCDQMWIFWTNSKSSTSIVAVIGRSIGRILFMDGEENLAHASPLLTVNRRKAAGGARLCCEWLWLGRPEQQQPRWQGRVPTTGWVHYTLLWAHQPHTGEKSVKITSSQVEHHHEKKCCCWDVHVKVWKYKW